MVSPGPEGWNPALWGRISKVSGPRPRGKILEPENANGPLSKRAQRRLFCPDSKVSGAPGATVGGELPGPSRKPPVVFCCFCFVLFTDRAVAPVARRTRTKPKNLRAKRNKLSDRKIMWGGVNSIVILAKGHRRGQGGQLLAETWGFRNPSPTPPVRLK